MFGIGWKRESARSAPRDRDPTSRDTRKGSEVDSKFSVQNTPKARNGDTRLYSFGLSKQMATVMLERNRQKRKT